MNESNVFVDFVTWVNDNPLPGAVVSTVIAALIVAIFTWAWKTFAKVLSRVLPRLGRWIWSQRLITVARARKLAIIGQQESWDAAQADAWAAADPQIGELTRQLRVVTHGLYPLTDDFSEPPSDLELLRSLAAPAAADEVKPPSPNPVPKVRPLPKPKWSVYNDAAGDGTDYILRNAGPRSVAKDVVLDPDRNFAFYDGTGRWSDLSGDTIGGFRGGANSKGWYEGVGFVVTWQDENGEFHNGEVILPPSLNSSPTVAHVPAPPVGADGPLESSGLRAAQDLSGDEPLNQRHGQ